MIHSSFSSLLQLVPSRRRQPQLPLRRGPLAGHGQLVPLRRARGASELPPELLQGLAPLARVAAAAGGHEVAPVAAAALAEGDDVVDLVLFEGGGERQSEGEKERKKMGRVRKKEGKRRGGASVEKGRKKNAFVFSLFFFSHRQPSGPRDAAVLTCFREIKGAS